MPMNALDVIRFDLQEAAEGLNRLIGSPEVLENISRAADLIVETQKAGGKVLSCGNGGSLCDAMHFAEEMTGRFRNDRPPYAAIAISDPSHMACVGNDYGYEAVFSRYVEGVAKKGDVLRNQHERHEPEYSGSGPRGEGAGRESDRSHRAP